MAENSAIEWTDHTFNPWIGCTKVSRAATGGGGCDGCYAEVSTPARVLRAKGLETWGPGAPRQRTKTWGDPVRWNKSHDAFYAAHGRRQRVFCASLADVFDNEVPLAWRADLLDLIAQTPNLDWLLLTKRIGNAKTMMADALHLVPEANRDGMIWPLPNVWLGATVVNQEEVDRDVPKLLATPARVRFLSMEPLLGPVEFSNVSRRADAVRMLGRRALEGIDWVIVGGESGPGARPMHPDWARSLRDQCAATGVPFLFKQWGEWCEAEAIPDDDERKFPEHWMRPDGSKVPPGEGVDFFGGDEVVYRAGKKTAGRLLDGREHNEFPEVR